MSHDPNNLLTQLEAAKNRIDPDHASLVTRLLADLSKLPLLDPHHVIRFHECLLFLRAFPHAPSLIPLVEKLLITFHQRIESLRASNADMSLFDDFDTSGIAGTTMQDTLSFDVAHWLVRRIPRNIEIAWTDYWDDYESERPRGTVWPRFIPLLEEDADVEANIPWQRWLDAARGRENPLPWLIRQFEQLPLPAPQRAELYDSLRLPVRWKLENLKLSRTRNFTRPRRFFFHTTPLIQRSEVSLARELAQPAPKFEKLSLAAGESVMDAIRDVMVVRYRELYGTTLGDPHTVVRADLGRGVVMHFWGLPPSRRLPLRAYLAGYTLKNGVPINYVEAIGLCEWIEVGFNTFYTYRQGETAWIYAQALRCLRALTAAKIISIYPYQIGQNNDEAIDSGAFWFYRKLGFRPGRADLQELCEREEKKIAANRQYKTPARILKRLAEAHMFYEVDLCGALGSNSDLETSEIARVERFVSGRSFRRAEPVAKSNSALAVAGPWDTFSTRNLGLLVNRRMAREFNGDSQKIRHVSTAAITRALKINPSRWTPDEQYSLENLSLILALIPNLSRWTPDEKQQLITIIRAKSAPNEMTYLHKTQRHPRLRSELLRLGS
ncbi:MAG TPA: hypothetical protein VGZ91_19890 [Candidatus Sulfotelmatobacter sp.]|jgi:hypothetical protein|nr:hypothetical protein [Candidatus Sulfotelmatobacter sp.]